VEHPLARFNPTDENRTGPLRRQRPVYRRAAAVRVAATGVLHWHGQDRRVVMLGDLNDTQEAATTQLLYGPPGSQYGTGGFAHSDRGDGAATVEFGAADPSGAPIVSARSSIGQRMRSLARVGRWAR
jgi:hypothetical protein